MGYLNYKIVDKAVKSQYPTWVSAKPNLQTFLNAYNKSQPIISSQFELVWSRWPRSIFFVNNISIPSVQTSTIELNHCGFTIPIPTHVMYENTEISMTVMADKEGYHYYDIRNMVLESGHPLVAGDPKSAVGAPWATGSDFLEIYLRNRPEDTTCHHWKIKNFRPTQLGELELSHENSAFVQFDLTGTFTHITYDCGSNGKSSGGGRGSSSSGGGGAANSRSLSDENPWETGSDSEHQFQGGEQTNGTQAEQQPTVEESAADDSFGSPETDKQWATAIDPENPDHDFDIMPDIADVASSERYVKTENCDLVAKISQNIQVNGIEGENEGNLTPQEMLLESQCDRKLQQAKEEFQKSLEEIGKMPADSAYAPQKINTQWDQVIDTGKPNQQTLKEKDKVDLSFNVSGEVRSQAQMDAYQAAEQRWKERVSTITSYYKDLKAQHGRPQAVVDF